MQVDNHLSAAQLREEIKRFLADKHRGISGKLFADVCGLSLQTLKEVFLQESRHMTYEVQIRVNRAYAAWKAGNIRVMQKPSGVRYVEYRKESKPVILPSMGLQMTPQGLKISVGMKNRHDYSAPSLDQQLRGYK